LESGGEKKRKIGEKRHMPRGARIDTRNSAVCINGEGKKKTGGGKGLKGKGGPETGGGGLEKKGGREKVARVGGRPRGKVRHF